MSTTTIRIDAALKARLEAIARKDGKTSHAFILEAIAQSVERAEHDDELQRLADARWDLIQTTGKTVPWEAAAAYVRAKGSGERPRKPAARKLGRRAR